MRELWEKELTPEEAEDMLNKIVARVRKYRMETPAIFTLEMHKPLANIGASAAIAVSPMLIPFFGFEAFDGYSRLLSKREYWERLIQMLEESRENPETKEQTA